MRKGWSSVLVAMALALCACGGVEGSGSAEELSHVQQAGSAGSQCTDWQLQHYWFWFSGDIATCTNSRTVHHQYYDEYTNGSSYCADYVGTYDEYCSTYCTTATNPASCY